MIKPKPKSFISQESMFEKDGISTKFSVVDFWQWTYSDLQQNNIRGILAEFIVAKALNISLAVRETWDDYDLVTPDGYKSKLSLGHIYNLIPLRKRRLIGRGVWFDKTHTLMQSLD